MKDGISNEAIRLFDTSPGHGVVGVAAGQRHREVGYALDRWRSNDSGCSDNGLSLAPMAIKKGRNVVGSVGDRRLSASKVLVTGGTGSFGSTLARKLLRGDVNEVRILSRDEAKQEHMRQSISDDRLRFHLGDIRDPDSVAEAMDGIDFVFHAAALKQVPSCEFFPLQAVKTNVIGSSNVIEAAHRAGVATVVCLSTDKAVYPINAMGMSKALMEKTAQAFARNHPASVTRVCLVRYGNVMYSRGSVIPLFVRQLTEGATVTITDGSMTRFMMSLSDSVDLVEYAFANGEPGDLFVRKAPACTVADLVTALGNLFGIAPNVTTIGARHGEKLHETLATGAELARSEDAVDYFRIRVDARGLDYGVFVEGELKVPPQPDYDSFSTRRLGVAEAEALLLTLPEIRDELTRSGRARVVEART
jgi:UDP-N-acetylglucosamine 4,6-dehydratase